MTAEELKVHCAGLNGPRGWYHRDKLNIRRKVLRHKEMKSAIGLPLIELLELSSIEAYLEPAELCQPRSLPPI